MAEAHPQGFGSDENGFNEISKAYKKNPSIENYVKLRRGNPEAQIEVAVVGGIESLFYMRRQLERYGISANLVASVMDADCDAISEISLQLMEKIIETRKLTKAGKSQLIRRGLAIPDKLIDWIITCSLDALSWNDELYIPRDLIVLIRERLGGSNSEYKQASEAYEHKGKAAFVAGQLKAQGIAPTFKRLGEIFGVAPSTVKRWFAPGEFQHETDRWSSSFDKNGKLIPLDKPMTIARK
jgi:hypothetical protein